MTKPKGVAIFDLDRTLTKGGSFTPFMLMVALDYPKKAPYIFSVALHMLFYLLKMKTRTALKEYMLNAFMYKMGRTEVDSFSKQFLARLEKKNKFFKDGLKAIDFHKKQGDVVVIATASMDFYVDDIAKKLGADHVIATTSVWRRDVIEPVIKGENCYGPEKARRVQAYLAGRKCGTVWFYSDHHTDEPTFELADKRVAVNPTTRLKKIAQERGYDIQNWT